MSSVSNFSSANVATDENTKKKRKKITTNESVNTDVDNVFEIDMTTDAETDAEAETETVAAKNLSHQKEIIRKLEEEYVEMNSYRKRFATSIDKYAKLLVQIDFGILEDKKPSKFREDVYDRLEEHKNQMLVMVENKDIKISLKDTILKQILNKRAFLIEKDYNNAENLNEYWNLAFNKVILNSKRYVKDHDYKFKIPKRNLKDHIICPDCGKYTSGNSCRFFEAVFISICGIFVGPIYPLVITAAVKILQRKIQIVSLTIMTAFGSSGGALFPFLVHIISQFAGTYIVFPVFIALFCVMLILWYLLPNPHRNIIKHLGKEFGKL
ncbi:hypothetical protein BVG19_g571 [[Candida] boidinii]|nr:hypothetical protein BVG19_g571 [[Candida] boidinii]OWB51480.1 hypothetical protein B5S27_g3043 [[Candida] boidinii]OWB65580.1 hypothetical protein B5S30_g906 [[Candida] boidinii]